MTKDDVEFYEAYLVLTGAKGLLPAGTCWDDLSHRQKNVLLDRSVAMLKSILSDPTSMRRLAFLSSSRRG